MLIKANGPKSDFKYQIFFFKGIKRIKGIRS